MATEKLVRSRDVKRYYWVHTSGEICVEVTVGKRKLLLANQSEAIQLGSIADLVELLRQTTLAAELKSIRRK